VDVPSDPKNPYNVSAANMSDAEKASAIEYAQRTNAWLAKNGSITVQSNAGQLRSETSALARTERLRAARSGQPYTGEAGHVLDTAITGKAAPPGGWADMAGTSTNVIGAGFLLESDRNWTSSPSMARSRHLLE
jgi:hypothetical protein